MPSRPKITLLEQVKIYFRDGWLCRWCGRPVVFPPALNALQQFVRSRNHPTSVAYFHPRWTRHDAPLLDHLGVVLDHVEAYTGGGATKGHNLVVACNKCNSLKSSSAAHVHAARYPKRIVRGKGGEPLAWDGLAAVFLALAQEFPTTLTATDRKWLAALKAFYSAPTSH